MAGTSGNEKFTLISRDSNFYASSLKVSHQETRAGIMGILDRKE
jgi:hypothetical protein